VLMEYPKNQMEFDRTFAHEDDCVKYLIEVKWPLGTHQNYTSQDRLQKYLDEFSFRYNRRKSNRRGLLHHRIIEQTMIWEPILSRDVFENKIQ